MSIVDVLNCNYVNECKKTYLNKVNFDAQTSKQTDTEIKSIMALYNDMTAVAKAKHYISTHKSFNEKDLLDYIGVSNHNKLTKAITSCCGGYASEAK